MPRSKGSQNNAFGKSLHGYVSLSKGGGGKYRATLSKEITNLAKIDKQVCFSLGINIHPQNLGEAIKLVNLMEEKILEDLEKENFDKTFSKYKPQKLAYNSNLKLLGYYLNNFEQNYFYTRAITSQSKFSCKQILAQVRFYFKNYLHEIFSIEIVKKVILEEVNTTYVKNKLISIGFLFDF